MMFHGLGKFCRVSLGCQPTRIGWCLFSLIFVQFSMVSINMFTTLGLRTSGEFRASSGTGLGWFSSFMFFWCFCAPLASLKGLTKYPVMYSLYSGFRGVG